MPAKMEELSIKKNMAWNSIGSMFYLGCQWIITILVVRLSSDYTAAGTLALGMAIANIFNPIGYYKIRTFQVSDLSNAYSSCDYIGFRLITTIASFVAMLAYSVATCTINDAPSIIAYGLFSCGPVLVDVLHGIDQKNNRMDYIGKSLIIRGAISLLAFSVGMITFDSLFLSLCAMTVLTYAAIGLYDVPATRKIEKSLKPCFDRKRIARLATTCLPLVLALLFLNAAPSVSRQILASLYSTSDLGIYASVAAPIAIIQMGVQYIYAPLLGKFAKHSFKNEGKLFIHLLLKTIAAILILTTVLMVLFLLFGRDLLTLLYGSSISDYAFLIPPLVICTSLTALIWFCGDLLVVIRKIHANLICYLICFIVSTITATPFLENCGINGASYCLIAGFALGLIGSLIVIANYCLVIENKSQRI